MHTLNLKANQLKLFGAILAIAALVAAALALTLTAGPTLAQSDTPTPTPTPSPYADPQPCGPGAGVASMAEPHEITEGHFALFDAYWESTTPEPGESTDLDPANTGVLHTNLCPPKVIKNTETNRDGTQITVTTLTASGIDIDEAIFHVLDTHKATVVANASANPSGVEIATAEYVVLGNYAATGSEVWWLRLDDPDTDTDETSDLSIGFSTKRFDTQYWAATDGNPPFRFKFELERNPGIPPANQPHFLAYRADPGGSADPELVWDSATADVTDMMLEPGQLEDLQWIFTQPGTYELSVHLQGWVRQDNPYGPSDSRHGQWKRISNNVTETSEVKRYVIQIGSELTEVEPPRFGVSFSVDQSAPSGTKVGNPVQVFRAEVDALEYQLSGDGHDDFALVSTTDPDTVQIVVADSVVLDHERQIIYDLTLGVTDNVDHESNHDPRLDDTLAVKIELTGYPRVTIEVDNPNPSLGETVTFTARLHDVGETESVNYSFTFSSDGAVTGSSPSQSKQHTSPTTETVQLEVFYRPKGIADTALSKNISAEPVTVTWRNP